ncbi:MAG TPA: GntR family transcriptional regulator, partial [Limnochordia bacterium]
MATSPRERCRALLLADIRRSRWEAGEWLPSERSLAHEYGVSRSTVREVLEQLAAEDLIEKVPGSGTRLLRTHGVRRAQTVGFLVPRLHADLYSVTAEAFVRALEGSGVESILRVHREDPVLFERTVESLLEHGCQGLAVTVPRRLREAELRLLEAVRVPVVAMCRRIPHLEIDQIVIDNEAVAALATEHLVELGHRRIVHLGELDYPTGRQRLAGYRRALAVHGIEADPTWVVDLTLAPPGADAAEWALQILRERRVDFTGIVAFNDTQALAAI